MTAAETMQLGMEVPIASIDGRLRQLWEADEASTNASLMNFAIYAESPNALERNSEIIQGLTREHACRAILIELDREGDDKSIRSWITAHCHLSNGRKSVCCEQLAFLLKGYAPGRMRNTVFAHLSSDLPLVFWWQGELSEIFEEGLYSVIDRFIFDSSEWRDPAAGFERLVEASERVPRLVFQDLAWTRTFYFRLAVAALFDDLVAQRALPKVETVRIVAHPEHRISALLLVAWLATQAGWRRGLDLDLAAERAAGCSECLLFESKEGRNVAIQLDWKEESAPLGRLEIEAPDCVVSIAREPGAKLLQHALKCPGHELESSGPADGDAPAELVADQLSRGGKNALLRKVWPVFFELLQG